MSCAIAKPPKTAATIRKISRSLGAEIDEGGLDERNDDGLDGEDFGKDGEWTDIGGDDETDDGSNEGEEDEEEEEEEEEE